MQILTDRPARIAAIMNDEGVSEMQAHNILRAHNIMHKGFRASPRHADYRFGREF